MVESKIETKNKSQELFEKAKKILPGGVNSPVRAFDPNPFFVDHAKGSKLYGADGNAYVDYCMAYGALLFGHANTEILNAVKEQLKKGTLYGAPTALETDFAELISKLYPSVEMLRLVNSGTEATMHAIRATRGFTGRKKIVKFEGCFHGAHDNVLVKAGSGAATFGVPTSLGIPEETTQNTIVLPYNSREALEETFKREGNEIAAVIVEPVMGNGGLILPQNGFLSYLRKLTQEYGTVLVFDEIITGFRLALGGAQDYFNLKPDMTTLGKVLGGGFPIAAYGGRKEIMQHITPAGKVYQAGTFSGNPVSATAGYTILNILSQKKNDIYPKLEKNCADLKSALVDLAANYHVDAQVYNIASMFQIFFTSQPVTDMATAKTSDLQKFQAYFQELLNQGVFIPPAQFETCFLSTAHSDEDLKFTIKAFDGALYAASKKSRSTK
ncbi:MAG: glutamate-1-semialdehyde 2,1-aminomutase [Candidatus Bathyarchaeota archaeon]|nr:glutamate-1-semialdehyde 2,1-aminomutase [Candidatus Bathyarchaeota archaeon]